MFSKNALAPHSWRRRQWHGTTSTIGTAQLAQLALDVGLPTRTLKYSTHTYLLPTYGRICFVMRETMIRKHHGSQPSLAGVCEKRKILRLFQKRAFFSSQACSPPPLPLRNQHSSTYVEGSGRLAKFPYGLTRSVFVFASRRR